jgi:hypothetical protein
MRRRKNRKVYIRATASKTQHESSGQDSISTPFAPTPELRDFGMGMRRSGHPRETLTDKAAEKSKVSESKSKTRSQEALMLRGRLRKITGASAVIGCLISAAAYASVRQQHEEELSEFEVRVEKICAWVLTCLQVTLIFAYSATFQKYLEMLRVTLRCSRFPVPSLWKSKRLLCFCVLECSFHLILAPPFVRVQGEIEMPNTHLLISLDDFIFPLVLLRNYHSLRFLFWCSRFSEPRTYLYSVLVDNQFTNAFVLKCYLEAYSLKLVIVLYCLLITITGFTLFVLEKGTSDHTDIFTKIWIAAYTVVTIGYGDVIPANYFGKILIIASCFIGCFLSALILSLSVEHMSLSQAESSMYSALAVKRFKSKWKVEALTLLQAWWRFILMRMRRRLQGNNIVHFYTQLRLYREVLAAAEREKDRRFETQVEAFHTSIHRQFRAITEYLQSIEMTRGQLIDAARAQYHINETVRQIRRLAIRQTLTPIPSITISSNGDETSRSGRRIEAFVPARKRKRTSLGIKARLNAHNKLRVRLIRAKDEDLATPIIARSFGDFPESMTSSAISDKDLA